MRDFDQEIVARYGGFRDADDYYHTVASSHYAGLLPRPHPHHPLVRRSLHPHASVDPGRAY